MSLIPITSFKCVHCGRVTDIVKCASCYPSPLFPHIIPYHDKMPPTHDYEAYKKWDRWFTWKYLMEFDEDPEDLYMIHA